MQQEQLKVLLIEDYEGFARAVSGMLEQTRDTAATVVTAPSLDAGLAQLAQSSFDVAILEFFLPDGAGLPNISILRTAAPRVPLMVVGSADDETLAVEAVHAGAQDYLVKSQLSPRWLLRSIRYAIERHEADMALLDAEEQYRGIFDHLVEGIFQTTSDGRYLLANAALTRIYGYASPQELKKSVTDIGRKLYVLPGRRDEFIRIMQEHDTITDFESQIYRKDGSMIWISENCRAIRDLRGKLLYYEGTVEDITQRQEAEIKLRDSETLYHSLVETLPQNIFRKDLSERFTFANQQFCKTLDRKLEDIVGKTDFDFFPAEMAAKYQADDRRVMEAGQAFETIEEHRPPGHDKMYVQVVKTPLRGADGQIIGLQGIFWDITAAKLAEEQIRKTNAELARSREQLRAKNLEMEDDLTMAREIQLTMLPQQYPTFPRDAAPEASAFQFTHRYHPTGTVGGDFFNVSALSDTEAVVFICDVAGHGVRSALVAAMIRALVEELKPLANEPGDFLTKLNSDLCAILKHTGTPMLTTAFYLVANAATGVMRYANAGHPKPLLVRRSAGQVEPLNNAAKKSQPVLGLFEKALYQTSEVMLARQDLVMLFTDGLYEVQAPNQDLYTQDMLAAGVQQRLNMSASRLFDAVLHEARDFAAGHEFADDVCLVGMELAGKPPV
jgi:sigma-B regulation protein RsbU (phosphoserine phosphatase)